MDLASLITGNQLIQSGLILGLAGGAVAAFVAIIKRVPMLFWSVVDRYLCVTITIDRIEDVTYYWVIYWLQDFFTNRKQKNFSAQESRTKQANQVSPSVLPESTDYMLYPGYGTYFFRKGFKIGRITISKKESSSGPLGQVRTDKIVVIKIIFGGKKDITDILEKGRSLHNPDTDKIHFYTYFTDYGGAWKKIKAMIPLSPSNYAFQGRMVDDIVLQIKKFLNNFNEYYKRGLPWQFTYVLHGITGNGKTSLVKLVASLLNKNIAILDIESISSNKSFREALLSVPNDCIILIEDIHSLSTVHTKSTKRNIAPADLDSPGLTLSGVLNCLDGIFSSENGRIIFITTNYLEKLDPAMLRPGRADRIIELCNPEVDQFKLMYKNYFPDAQIAEWANHYKSMSGAAIQNILSQCFEEEPKARKLFTEAWGNAK